MGRGDQRPWPARSGGCAPEQIGVIASPKMANEDLFALRRLLDGLGIRQVAASGAAARSGRPGRLPDPGGQESELARRGAPGLRRRGAERHRSRRPAATQAPVDLRTRPAGGRPAGGGRARSVAGRRHRRLHGLQRELDERPFALGPAGGRLGRARGDVHEFRRAGCSASGRRSSRWARRWPNGTSSAGSWPRSASRRRRRARSTGSASSRARCRRSRASAISCSATPGAPVAAGALAT